MTQRPTRHNHSAATLRRMCGIERPDLSDQEILKAWEGITRFVTKRRHTAHHHQDADLWDGDALLAMWKAARSYRHGRGATFTTHAVNYARWLVGKTTEVSGPLGYVAHRAYRAAVKAQEEPPAHLLPPASLDALATSEMAPLEYLAAEGCFEREVLAVEEERRDRERLWAAIVALTPEQRKRLLIWLESGSFRKASERIGISHQATARCLHGIWGELRAACGVAG